MRMAIAHFLIRKVVWKQILARAQIQQQISFEKDGSLLSAEPLEAVNELRQSSYLTGRRSDWRFIPRTLNLTEVEVFRRELYRATGATGVLFEVNFGEGHLQQAIFWRTGTELWSRFWCQSLTFACNYGTEIRQLYNIFVFRSPFTYGS